MDILLDTHTFIWFFNGVDHTVAYEALELVHRDPFDRILVAQAMVEKMTIITKDDNIQKYIVKTNW